MAERKVKVEVLEPSVSVFDAGLRADPLILRVLLAADGSTYAGQTFGRCDGLRRGDHRCRSWLYGE